MLHVQSTLYYDGHGTSTCLGAEIQANKSSPKIKMIRDLLTPV